MSKEYKTGYLGYNYENDRFGILAMDLWQDEGLHCGETFQIWNNDKWETDRIEMSKGQYYLVYSKLAGDQLEGLKVRY